MKIQYTNKKLKANIKLPGSKSISNRALMIRAYSGLEMAIDDLSDADDTRMLLQNLDQINNCSNSSIPMVVDCGNAGTVFRFLLTYLATKPGTWMLTGTVRMKSRPIADLVHSLRQLGAEITYTEEEGYPPVKITGATLKGGKTGVSMEKSSQFASSLIMAAPYWEKGLELELTGNLSSVPYLDMTLQMMEHYGAKLKRDGRIVNVFPLPYHKAKLRVEPDWSSAAFWYELVALSNEGELFLKGLSTKSLQGDKEMIQFFTALGVESYEETDGILIFKSAKKPVKSSFNLQNHPDMLPSLVATCCGIGLEADFTGLQNLQYKESDRTAALQNEMQKIGCLLQKTADGSYHLKPAKTIERKEPGIHFNTYHDHRMAMAFAPLVLKLGTITIESPEVIEKSYPKYWDELFKTGIAVQITD
jgi:3-phosphoshikimate 1-carboxyvinyltransferase